MLVEIRPGTLCSSMQTQMYVHSLVEYACVTLAGLDRVTFKCQTIKLDMNKA